MSTPTPNAAVSESLSWLKSALACPEFKWDADQHAMATAALEAALAQQVPEPQPVNAQMLEALRKVWSEGVIPDGFALLQDQVCDAITAAEAAQAGSAQQVPAVPATHGGMR